MKPRWRAACAAMTTIYLGRIALVMGELQAPSALEAPPTNALKGNVFIQGMDSFNTRPSQAEQAIEKPVVQQATLYSEEPFGPKAVPKDIFLSGGNHMGLRKMPTPEGVRNGSGEAICNSGYFGAVDQRKMDEYPNNVIGRLYLKFPGTGWGWCSAMQLSEDVVLTAAHCVYSCKARAWVEGGGYYDGRYGESYRNYAPIKAMTTWTSCDMTDTGFYDFALMRLGNKLPKSGYPITYAQSSKAFDSSDKGYVFSYPAVTKSGNIPHLSFQEPIDPKDVYGYPGRVELPLSIEQGSSGSPLFLGGLPSSFPWNNAVVGVSSYGYSNGLCPNGFAVFTEAYNPVVLLRSLRS